MPYPIKDKLVIAIASSALFDLTESHRVFQQQGPQAYKTFQEQNLDVVLPKGVAFPFIKRFLKINERFPERKPVEVVLLSKNSAATGKRVFRSIAHYGLDITRAAFIEGESPYQYIPAYNASLFLSADERDVLNAIGAGYPGGLVLPSSVIDDDQDELRMAFDFDGVIADDEAETIFRQGQLPEFQKHEVSKSGIAHNPGPLADLVKKISALQKLEDLELENNHQYKRILSTAIVTARNAPSHERVITTLESWGVNPNKVFFLGGMEKDKILSILKPHMFFDDQRGHLHSKAGDIPMVHIPFGVANQT